jgi:tRNA(Ile)-lysidine synthase
VAVHPEGWAEIDGAALLAAAEPTVRRVLRRVVMAVGGLIYPPRGERLQGLVEALMAGRLAGGRTLGGCRVVVAKEAIRVLREASAMGDDVAVTGSGDYSWDGRFALRLEGSKTPPGTRISALGKAGWAALSRDNNSLKSLAIPAELRETLPALWDLDGVVNVYHLLYRRKGGDPDSVRVVSAVFHPRQPLAGVEFAAFQPSPYPRGKPKATVAD